MYVPKVLVLGRDAAVERELVRTIVETGFPCRCTSAVIGARGALEAAAPDLIVFDAEPELIGRLLHLQPTRRRAPVETIAVVPAAAVARARRLGAGAALPKPVDATRLRHALDRAAERIQLARRQRAGAPADDGLERLARSTQELTGELLALYSSARARGLSLDLGAAHAVGAGVAARLFARRDTLLLRYHVRDQCLRGHPIFEAVPGPDPALEIPLSSADVQRFLAVDQQHALGERIGRALGRSGVLALLLGQGLESCVVLALVGSDEQPLTPAEAELWQRFGAFLGLSFAGAQLYKDILDLSVIDGLTGLYNHRFFHERLRDEVARAARHGHPISLLFCDIDDFKRYNDRNGHAAGDSVLATLGQIFRNRASNAELAISFRESDVRARYGGEEFAVLLPETGVDGALTTAERLREAVAATAFPAAEGQPHGRLTMSIGVCEFPRSAADRQGLVEIADHAMYRAKQLGKNRVVAAPAR